MKTIICNLPAWLKVLLYFVVLALARFIAGVIPQLNDFLFFMLIALLLSWVFLWAEGKTLKALRLIPVRCRHWRQFLYGITGGLFMLIVTAAVTIYLTGDQWQFNRLPDPVYLLVTFLAVLWSAFVQEFVFRGYPFQTLVDHYGAWKAQLIIAIPFGLMHVDGTMDLQTFLITMMTTGLGSVLFGMAYLSTRHLALPMGLHFGWNYAQALIPRTAGATGTTVISVTGNPAHYSLWNVIAPFVAVVLCAIILIAFTGRGTKNERPPALTAS